MPNKNNPPPSQTLRLKPNHTWKAPDGYKIVVLDRGAASFNVPEAWIVGKLEPFEMYDKEPPDDNVRLSVTLWQFHPQIDWTGLPLGPLLAQATDMREKDSHDILESGEIVLPKRDDLELAWRQQLFMDPKEHREAYSRHLVARGFGVVLLLTLDFWKDDAKKVKPMWEEILRSLELGRIIPDPTRGVIQH
jgi:hypothetical protein